MPADEPVPTRPVEEEEPDPRLLWKWVGSAVRPYIGWILIGLGAFLMLLGWFGVSREAIVEKQIPYLISGGLGGVFLAVLGAYFLGTQQLRSDSGRLDRAEQMIEELHLALLARPDAPPVPEVAPLDGAAVATNGSRTAARRVVAVDGGELFHRPACAMATDKEGEDLTPAAARKRGLRPCPVCEPAPATA